MEKVKLIAEIANAHQGDPGRLEALVRAAAGSGADAVKFQWFKYDRLATPDYAYYEMYRQIYIPEQTWSEMAALARSLGLEVWADVFDSWGLELARRLSPQLEGVKLPATVMQSDALAEGIMGLNKPVMAGVGGWYDGEIEALTGKLARSGSGRPEDLILMHGFQGYPTRKEDSALLRIRELKRRSGLRIGFADHIDGSDPLAVELPVYAYFAGATVIEKHMTLDRAAKGHDYYSSLEPEEFARMAAALREAEAIMGDGQVNERQRAYLKDALRAVAGQAVAPGEIVTLDKVAFKRSPEESAFMPAEARSALPLIARTGLDVNAPVGPRTVGKPVVAIAVVCRLKSTRLARKALLPIYGIPSIERCLLNCLAVEAADHVVLATSDLPQDDPLEAITLDGRVKVVRGDPDHVARRIAQAASLTSADIVLRVTGDCPAVSPELLDLLIRDHLRQGADFSMAADAPVGTSADVMTTAALLRLLDHPEPLTHTEYLSFYFRNNPEAFKVNLVKLPPAFRLPECRLTLDEQPDLDMFEALYSGLGLGREPLRLMQLQAYLAEHPEVAAINSQVALKWRDDPELLRELDRRTRLDFGNRT